MLRYTSKIAWQALGDEAVVLDLESRQAMGLNSTGALTWSLLETHSVAEIAAALSARFGVEPSQAADDVRAFVSDMCTRGLVEEVE